MYFPYLRGKEEELIAVREADFLSHLIIPVFEPTNPLNQRGRNNWLRVVGAGRRFAVIVNSAHGNPPPPPHATRDVCLHRRCSIRGGVSCS